jgi:methionyl-tRNA formyltransferase
MINLYLLGAKAYIAIKNLSEEKYHIINRVIIGKDKSVTDDCSVEIASFCISQNIPFTFSNKPMDDTNAKYSIAIGWRWILNLTSKLIVFHDSILPRLRGFNPLVTALIQGDEEIGISVLYANENFDTGDIIIQEKITIAYPIKIKKAIELIGTLYGKALNEILKKINFNNLIAVKQDESLATYSLWRDEADYKIDWNQSCYYIQRFIDAVGEPYKGAFTTLDGKKLIIKDAFVIEQDYLIENRTPGKVLFKKNDNLFIVCGIGLLSVSEFYDIYGNQFAIDKFRTRFI